MSEKLSERLQVALLEAYHEAQNQSLTSAKLSEAQRLIDDQVGPLEADVEALEKAIRNALDEMGDNREVILEQALAEHLRGASG